MIRHRTCTTMYEAGGRYLRKTMEPVLKKLLEETDSNRRIVIVSTPRQCGRIAWLEEFYKTEFERNDYDYNH